MFVNKTYLIYFATFFSVKAQWLDPPYNLTKEAIVENVRLEGEKLFIPENLDIDTPVLNLFYDKSEYKLDLHSFMFFSLDPLATENQLPNVKARPRSSVS